MLASLMLASHLAYSTEFENDSEPEREMMEIISRMNTDNKTDI
jgi:hypothetical protein